MSLSKDEEGGVPPGDLASADAVQGTTALDPASIAAELKAAGLNKRGEYVFGDWRIEYRPPPIPIRTMDWQFWHDDYDGAPDGNDLRCGVAASIEAAIAEIHNIEELEAELV